MEYSDTIIQMFLDGIKEAPKPVRELRLLAEKIRLQPEVTRAFEKALGISGIDSEKLRQHCLEAARRLERSGIV